MASLKLPLQVSCPNCQVGNFPGSPYCSRCGAPLIEAPAGPPPIFKAVAPPEDPIKKLITEGQDPSLVRQTYNRALAILTTGETIEYISIAGRGGIGHAPDCVVATTKRIMLYRKKMMAKVELDDCYWRDVCDVSMKDGKNGVVLKLDAIQGWHLTIDGMPKAQAWRVYEIALEQNDRLRERLQQSTPAVAAPLAPLSPATSTLPLPTRPAATQSIQTLIQSGESASALLAPAILHEAESAPPPMPVQLTPPAPAASFVPTPQSVLQSILQHTQDVGNNGEPTRPMQFSAAAFQAPALLDAQSVTIHDTNTDTDPRMRSSPPLTTLEQIAVFSGPLTFNQSRGNESSTPLNPYSIPISGPLSQPPTDRLPRIPLPSSPKLTSGALPSQPLNSTPLADSSLVDRSAQSSAHSESNSVQTSAQIFGALPSGILSQNISSSNNSGALTEVELHADAPQLISELNIDTSVEMVDIMSIMQPTAPMFTSGPLPLPGSMSSGPLLAATPQPSHLSVVFDSGNMATQRLYMEPDSDADRPTDINLGQFSVQPQTNGRSAKSASAPKPAAPRASGNTSARSGSAKSNGDDPISKMKQLKMLLDAGFITDGDYEAKKADILARFF